MDKYPDNFELKKHIGKMSDRIVEAKALSRKGDYLELASAIELLSQEIEPLEEEIAERNFKIQNTQELIDCFYRKNNEDNKTTAENIESCVAKFEDGFKDEHLFKIINNICYDKNRDDKNKIEDLKSVIKDIKKIVLILSSEKKELEDERSGLIKQN